MMEENGLPMGWVETTLGEVLTLQRGFDLPKIDRATGAYPLMASNGQDGTHDEYKVKGPGVITGRSGSLGSVFFVKMNFWPLNTTLWVKDFKGNSINFIYYFLKTFPFERYNSGSGVPTLNRNHIHPITVVIPSSLLEQKAIASILTSFDDKIELLQAQNETLETIAQTIFKEWFGKYQVGDELPEGWRVGKITELFEVRDGTHDSPKQKDYGKKLITSKHLSSNNIDFDDAYFISIEDYNQINNRSKVEFYDILFSMIGTIGLTYLEQNTNIDYAIKNVALFKTSQNKDWAVYTYLWLTSFLGKHFISTNKSGSTQEYVSLTSLRNIEFNIPDNITMKLFNNIGHSIFEKIHTNTQQIQTLQQTRDTLLPKLMSGKVRVDEFKE